MKKVLLAFIAIIFSTAIFAQVTEAEKELKKQKTDTIDGWKKGGVISLSFGNVSLTDWAAGGQNSISANGLISLYANQVKGNSTWDNTLDIGYGILKQGDEGSIMKTDDKIDFSSKYGKKAFSNFYYAALLNFKTQMTQGYKYPDDSTVISNLLAPAYLLGAIGMDYKPNKDLSIFIAPVTAKITIVNDPKLNSIAAFGVDTNAVIRSEFGGYIKIAYKKDLMKNVTVATKLDLFSNYLHNPQNIDVSWETLVSMKVNKYISATVFLHLLYDDDVDIQWTEKVDGLDKDHLSPRLQIKRVLGVGFTYKF